MSARTRIWTVLILFTLCVTKIEAEDWYAYRHDIYRTGSQEFFSDLANPSRLANLSIKWQFPPDQTPAAASFSASAIIVDDTVYIGDVGGRFYALNAVTGSLKWQFPKASDPPLNGTCGVGGNGGGFGQYGIHSSATYALIAGQDAVVFGAPDPSPATEGGLGSARLFALSILSGELLWKSDVVAHVSGCTDGSLSELHERIAYSSPLVIGGKIYIGVHDTGDNPIQNGKVVAVDQQTGKIDANFRYASTTTRGGGVWNSPATDGAGVYFTTGNTASSNASEPTVNHGLSMIRVDRETGNLIWAFQPVPFNLDGDADWAAGATVMSTSCGRLIASVQKDGWTYAVNAGTGRPGAPSVAWQFPPTGFPFTKYEHGDTHYKRPGAAWNDVLIITAGGESLRQPGYVADGYSELHALNACTTDEKRRVRWIADITATGTGEYRLSSPTVVGGIVYVGTAQGHLMVLGDPSVVPAAQSRCTNRYHNPDSNCISAGYAVVPVPTLIRDIPMPDLGDTAGLRHEVALANGRAFVATGNGHVYMLDTATAADLPGNCIAHTYGCGSEVDVLCNITQITPFDVKILPNLGFATITPGAPQTFSFIDTRSQDTGNYQLCLKQDHTVCSNPFQVNFLFGDHDMCGPTGTGGAGGGLGGGPPHSCVPHCPELVSSPRIVGSAISSNGNSASQPSLFDARSWKIQSLGHTAQRIPLRGFYIAHLLSGDIAVTIGGVTIKQTPGAFWVVKSDALMDVQVLGESAIIETIRPNMP